MMIPCLSIATRPNADALANVIVPVNVIASSNQKPQISLLRGWVHVSRWKHAPFSSHAQDILLF
jgi:hypothetical protein